MSWFILILAGLLEIFWAIALKRSDGFTKLIPAILTVVGLCGSVAMLGWALKSLPVGTAYAIWVGIGAAGTAIVGVLWLGESVSTLKIFSFVLILSGLVGLKLSASLNSPSSSAIADTAPFSQ